MHKHPDSDTVFTINAAEQAIIRRALHDRINAIHAVAGEIRRVTDSEEAFALVMAHAFAVADVLDGMGGVTVDYVTREDWQQVAHDCGAISIDARNIRRMSAEFTSIAAAEDATDSLMAAGFSVSHIGASVWGGPTYMQDPTTGEFTLPEVTP